MNTVSRSRAQASWSLRDIVLAVRGPEESAAADSSYLAGRVTELGRLDRSSAEGCLQLLLAAARDGSDDPEVLEALVLLGLAHPKSVARQNVALANYGRRAANLYERHEREPNARALLALLAERFADNRAVERDLASHLRRTGELDELVRRYVSRAQERIDAGAPGEAIPWLQEVLTADPSRKDIARMIRDLRFEESERITAKKRSRRLAAWVLGVSTVLSLLVLREQKVGEAFAELGGPSRSDLGAMEARLDQLETFMADYPLWHGTLGVLEERARLRAGIDALRNKEAIERERAQQLLERRDVQAETARSAGRRAAEVGDWTRALSEFQAALDLASADWAERAWVERNVEALERLLGETR